LPFNRRSALYLDLDSELRSRTRFFAAAALTNSVLADLYALIPHLLPRHSYHFLNELGALLEAMNVHYAREIKAGTASCRSLDYYLVSSEQRLAQTYVDAHQGLPQGNWERVRRELNALLNKHPLASFVSRWSVRGRHFYSVLKDVRRDIGVALDFADESHRVRIGLALIQHIQYQEPCRHAADIRPSYG
jgi:hypothetical protein